MNSESQSDYYLANPPRQPKQEIAEYVEREGIPVPKRFDGLKEALASGKPFVIRSEHPQDYSGISGLLRSFHITPEIMEWANEQAKKKRVDWNFMGDYNGGEWDVLHSAEGCALTEMTDVGQDLFEKRLALLSGSNTSRYTKLLGIDLNRFRNEVSYSYWELLKGINRTIIADSAIAGRYHIFSKTIGNFEDLTAFGYSIFDNGVTETSQSKEMPPETEPTIPSLIELYEKIRHLERFDVHNCPMLEAQTVGSDHFLLQYHRARDFKPPQFTLNRDPEKDEMETVWVRGATPKEGLLLTTNIRWGDATKHLPEEEEGGIDLHWNIIFSQLMVLRRKIQIERAKNMQWISLQAQDNHLSKAKLFKPEVSAVLSGLDSIVDSIERGTKRLEFYKEAHPVRLRIISDGRKAYLKRVD